MDHYRPPVPAGKSRTYASTAGTTEAEALKAAKDKGSYCSFADVNRACHRWLMARDPLYRRNYELWHNDRSAARPFAGF